MKAVLLIILLVILYYWFSSSPFTSTSSFTSTSASSPSAPPDSSSFASPFYSPCNCEEDSCKCGINKYKFVRIYSFTDVYNYDSKDGKYLRYFMKDPIRRIEWRGDFEIWGYVGGGDPIIESILGQERWQKNINYNWELITEGGGVGFMDMTNIYPAYVIEITF